MLSKALTSIHFFEFQIFDLDNVKDSKKRILLNFGLINSHSVKIAPPISTSSN